jgi:hypothetical protein
MASPRGGEGEGGRLPRRGDRDKEGRRGEIALGRGGDLDGLRGQGARLCEGERDTREDGGGAAMRDCRGERCDAGLCRRAGGRARVGACRGEETAARRGGEGRSRRGGEGSRRPAWDGGRGLRARGGDTRAGACVRGSRRPARDGGGSGRVGDGRTKIVDAYSKGLRNSRYLGRGVILTNDNLVKRGWKGSTKCSFCNQNKTIQRLFFDCYIARNIWRIINFALHIGRSSCINHLTRNWYISKKTTHRKRLLIGVASMFWSI